MAETRTLYALQLSRDTLHIIPDVASESYQTICGLSVHPRERSRWSVSLTIPDRLSIKACVVCYGSTHD
jgi:hypothetical protein